MPPWKASGQRSPPGAIHRGQPSGPQGKGGGGLGEANTECPAHCYYSFYLMLLSLVHNILHLKTYSAKCLYYCYLTLVYICDGWVCVSLTPKGGPDTWWNTILGEDVSRRAQHLDLWPEWRNCPPPWGRASPNLLKARKEPTGRGRLTVPSSQPCTRTSTSSCPWYSCFSSL